MEFESYTRACRDCVFYEQREGDTGWCRYCEKRVSGSDRRFPDAYAWNPPPGVSTEEWRERCDLITSRKALDPWIVPGSPPTNTIEGVKYLFGGTRLAYWAGGAFFCWIPAVDDHPDAVAEAAALAGTIKGQLPERRRATMGTVLYMLKYYTQLVERAKGTDREAEQLGRSLKQLDKIIRQLPDDLRAVLCARYKDGLTQTETAKRLKVNQSTVSRREEKAVGLIAERSDEPYLLVYRGEEDATIYVNISPADYAAMARAGREFVWSMLAGAEVFKARHGAVYGVFNEELRRQLRSGERADELGGELIDAVAAEWQKIMAADNPAAYCIGVIRQKAVDVGKRWRAEREARANEEEIDEDRIAEELP